MEESCPPQINPPSYLHTPRFLALSSRTITLIAIPTHFFGFYCILFKISSAVRSAKIVLFLSCLWCLIYDIAQGFLSIPFILIPTFSGATLGWASNLKIEIHMVVGLFLLLKALEEVYRTLPNLPNYIKSMRIDVLTSEPFDIIIRSTICSTTVAMEILFLATLNYYNLYKKSNLSISLSTRKMQKSFFLAICVQIMVPAILLALPLIYVAYLCINETYNQAANNFFILSFGIYGTSSTLSMILTHRNFRKTLFCIGKIKKKKEVSINIKESKIVISRPFGLANLTP
ncbi:unnamed protein product [Caenorhabditis angaria]|uniref:Serpentine Receptor, class H n=1 Tax=Caenorhabditis angaria TaxID=860376 RepID=A0A9P1IZJ4_9PELO|nr:unnamed protein product [Caenorhabditis angaria]